MNFLRLMLVACVLLAQGWPVQALAAAAERDKPAACTEGCCSWLAEAGMSVCSCDESSTPAAPAGLPPLSGRELVPQVVWVELQDVALPQMLSQEGVTAAAVLRSEKQDMAPSPRLPVLFCALLN